MSEFHNASAIGSDSAIEPWGGEGLMDLTEQEVEALASGRESATEPTPRPLPNSVVPPLRSPWVWYCPDGQHGVGDICDDPVWVLMEWYCAPQAIDRAIPCTPKAPHIGVAPHIGCHWAVKP